MRGRICARELIGKISFTDHVWLLVTGSLPSAAQRRVLDATLVAIAEHGLVPSVQASRMTLAAAPEALQGAVAAGILGCGSVILGAAEDAGRCWRTFAQRRSATNRCGRRADAVVRETRAARTPHSRLRAPVAQGLRSARRGACLRVAHERRAAPASIVEAAKPVERVLPELTGKPLVMNVSGAIPAVLLDAGFPLLALKGVPLLARTASLIAHLLEEQQRAHRFRALARRRAGDRLRRPGARRLRAERRMRGHATYCKGVRIVEQGTFITGPCAGMMLADLGADVIKVESPDGDPYRAYQGGQYSPHFQAYNRNKRSLALDLKPPADRALFDDALARRRRLHPELPPGHRASASAPASKRLRELNPRLVYCSISGFGADGPYVDRPSYDSVAQAFSGFLSVVVDPSGRAFSVPRLPTPSPASTPPTASWARCSSAAAPAAAAWSRSRCWRR